MLFIEMDHTKLPKLIIVDCNDTLPCSTCDLTKNVHFNWYIYFILFHLGIECNCNVSSINNKILFTVPVCMKYIYWGIDLVLHLFWMQFICSRQTMKLLIIKLLASCANTLCGIWRSFLFYIETLCFIWSHCLH